MPELPEVETIIRRLRNVTPVYPGVIDQPIQSVEITWPKIIAAPSPDKFKQSLSGKTLIAARRRGKFLHFPLSDGHLIGHLRMSGDMRIDARLAPDGQPALPGPYDRVLINFLSSYRLVFSEIRKFGRLWYVEKPQEVFQHLGPEP